MADIEPYRQIQKTNIKEHNDLVAKINEIIDVINNTNLDTVIPKISALETEVSTIKATDSLQWTDIEGLKDSQSAQDVTIGALDAQVKGVTESLVSDIAIIDGITTGNMKVRVEREKATPIDSNDYNIQKPVSMELIQGSGPSTFKAQITLSDGTIIRSDDFMFTTEAIGTDVYISSFVFKNGNVAGTISADIGLSNGTTIEANNFVVPMDPSLLNTVQDLSTRLTAVEGGSVAGFKELEVQVNTNKNNITTLTTELDNLDIQKADQSNPAQTIKADTTDLRTVKLRDSTDAVGSYLQFNASADKPVRLEYYNGSEVVDSGFVATVDDNGNPKNFNIPSGGEVWEEVNLSNFPNDWVAGERIKIQLKVLPTTGGGSWTSGLNTPDFLNYECPTTDIIEVRIPDNGEIDFMTKTPKGGCISYIFNSGYLALLFMGEVYNVDNWNDFQLAKFRLAVVAFNGNGIKWSYKQYVGNNISNGVYRMWRLKK